ncbi:MAG: OmpA family protein [Alphaproteobacteria bacterium]|nr:OmpA family protein [Alphaproteobacteria bacterium]
MKKALVAAAAIVALPALAQAQSAKPGFYAGVEGGLNWLLSNTVSGAAIAGGSAGMSDSTGFAAGGVLGYDFVGPRVELEGVYRSNDHNVRVPGQAFSNRAGQLAVLANLLYDFAPSSTITPYIGAGAGVAFVDGSGSMTSTQFAYQGILGLGWNASEMFRINLDGRYHGTTNPSGTNFTWTNNNLSLMLGLTLKFVAAAAPPPPPAPPPAAPPSFMVFFDFDRSNLSAQAVSTIKQAAAAYKTRGQARVTATGHADRSGPDAYNMALSLRRANTVKDQLVREGVPATAIAVVGRGESMPLVKTADGVREPQNRRVEIVIQ